MGFNWREFSVPRFFGLDLKTNPIDVKDGFSLDCKNASQDSDGIVSKRYGVGPLFASDTDATTEIDEVGSCKINATKYYFRFSGGSFHYATSAPGAVTTISPNPAISTVNPIWWAVLDNKLFFVDGTNVLRYFDGSAIKDSSIYSRPTVALTTATVGTGFDYTYTIDNGLGESPACATLLANKASAATVRVTGNTGPHTLVAGDIVRVYSKATTIAAASKLVAEYTWTGADVTAGFKDLVTVAINDSQVQLYSELGLALNKSAPTGLTGIVAHYGRLIGWKGSKEYNSKSSNPHSWPDNSAQKEAFVYGFGEGDGEDIAVCISFRECLYVMKLSGIAVFGGVGPDDTGGNAYSFRRLETNGNGCIAGKSAAVVGEDEKSHLVYLSKQGFMATTGGDPIKIGEKIDPAVQGQSDAILSASVAFHHKRDGYYICFVGPKDNRTGWMLDVREDGGVMVGWFKWSGLPVKCVRWDSDRYIAGTYNGYSVIERNDGLSTDFADIAVEYLAAAKVDDSTDEITVTTVYPTGTPVIIRSNGTIPGGLTANVAYYAIHVSDTVIKLATTLQNALDGIAKDITSSGTGTHSIIHDVAIDAYYTTNWIKFKSASMDKKLSKLNVVLNALASSVNIGIAAAYDWVTAWGDVQTINIATTHPWGSGSWGNFVWGGGVNASPRNISITRRKCRSVRYKFSNSGIYQDFNLQGINQNYDYIRNRGNYS